LGKPAAGTIAKMRADLRANFNEYIRLRDWPACYSCGRDVSIGQRGIGPKYVAGHFYPKDEWGDALEFNEKNVHGQCQRCNTHRHGNLAPYARRLVQDFGPAIFETLAASARVKWDAWTIRVRLDHYRAAVRQIRSSTKIKEAL
jgi:5-methylcytosine-specific restriction endonuclease McrA